MHRILLALLGASLTVIAVASAAPLAPRPETAGSELCRSRAKAADASPSRGLLHLVADQAAALSDAEIAFIYLQANLFEVEKAELGEARGTAASVKEHGKMVAADHRSVVKAFEMLLQTSGIKPIEGAGSAKAIEQHKTVVAGLAKLSGADFDKAYLTHEVQNHRAVIGAVRSILLPAAKHPAIVKHFTEMLPAFEHHLAVTSEAASKLGLATGK